MAQKLAQFGQTRICCIGDIILDRYIYGQVERISPEAPVPILRYQQQRLVLGGAANVAANLTALGCQVQLCGVIGDSGLDMQILELMRAQGIQPCVVQEANATVPIKTRLVASGHQLLRVDQEDTQAKSAAIEADCRQRWSSSLQQCQLILLSDYAKGSLPPQLIQWIIRWAKQHDKMILVDPKGEDWRKYQGASLIKPNLSEFNRVAGCRLAPQADDFKTQLLVAMRRVLSQFALEHLLVTLSEYGMAYLSRRQPSELVWVATQPRAVFDVSGAGDTVLALLGASLATAPEQMSEAIQLANLAASLAVEKLGTATVTGEALLTRWQEQRSLVRQRDNDDGDDNSDDRPHNQHNNPSSLNKISTPPELCAIVNQLRQQQPNIRIGFTNGCFDCLHLGHLFSLEESKKRCDYLIVAINSDQSVRALKGSGRPLQDQATRSQLVAALACVDAVTLFDGPNAVSLIDQLRPELLAKQGYQPGHNWPEADRVLAYGGQVVTLPKLKDYSTSSWWQQAMGNKGDKTDNAK